MKNSFISISEMKNKNTFKIKFFIIVCYALLVCSVPVLVIDFIYKNKANNNDLEEKIAAIDNVEDVQIFIAGDSRARRQVMPQILERVAERKAVNIATDSGDMLTLYNALSEKMILDKDVTLVISASFFQINDGCKDYISSTEIFNMSLLEKITFFYGHYGKLADVYKEKIEKTVKNKFKKRKNADDNLLKEGGFFAVEGSLQLPIDYGLDTKNMKHPWYRNIELDGIRKKLFADALKKLGDSKCRIFIYQPPISPSFEKYIANSFIADAEKSYSGFLKKEVGKYRNMQFLDFFSAPVPGLTDTMYYDPQHLNKDGAVLFSEYLANELFAVRKPLSVQR